MNERIRELVRQAGFFPTELTQVGPSVEKFAELIGWEAIGLCRVNTDALMSPFLSEYEKGIVEGYRRANENLRFYFGVEE